MAFRIHSLAAELFQHYFSMTDAELQRHNAVKQQVKRYPDVPCRISLTDAPVGENVLLVHYCHQNVSSPFRASHAIYIRPGVAQAQPAADEVPLSFRHRLMSVRGFDRQHMMVEADAVEGVELETIIEQQFANASVDYIHLHFARAGCFAARVSRS